MLDMKQTLDKAASSLDPAIRNMAIRYKVIEQEKMMLDSFFAFYHNTIVSGSVGAAATHFPLAQAPAAAAKKHTNGSKPPREKEDKLAEFEPAITAIITATGAPMKLENLHAAYQTAHPEDSTSRETFRQRLIKRRHAIQLVPRQGYWPVGAMAPPTESEQQDA